VSAGGIWIKIEFPILNANQAVTQVIAIYIVSGAENVISNRKIMK
jgi:hypothetical protein